MAPGLVGPEKAARGKTAHRHLVAHDRRHERQGEDRLPDPKAARRSCDRIIRASSNPGDTVLDFFAGSGTTGAAVLEAGGGRSFILIDSSPTAIEVMTARFAAIPDIEWLGQPGGNSQL